MQKIHKRLAPNHITELSECEIADFYVKSGDVNPRYTCNLGEIHIIKEGELEKMGFKRFLSDQGWFLDYCIDKDKLAIAVKINDLKHNIQRAKAGNHPEYLKMHENVLAKLLNL